jgi:hypothetical protein
MNKEKDMGLPKTVRTPRNIDSITAGALKLSLQDKVALWKALKESIEAEVKERDDQATAARTLVNGIK